MTLTIQQRIIKMIDIQKGMTKSRFCDKNEISKGTFFSMLKKQTNPSLDTIVKILKGNPEICPDWLILGKGGMYKNEKELLLEGIIEEKQIEINYLNKKIKILEGKKR